MCNLDKYVEKVKEYIEKNPGLTENEIIMYVYLDLGERFKFDQDFFFGGNKKKKRMYIEAQDFGELNECMEKNKIICKSSSYILEYILRKLDVNIRTANDIKDLRKYKHVYNIITPKDGSEEYSIDLQEDIINIHYHSFPKNFGLSLKDGKTYIVSRKSQQEMHKKFGYVSRKNPYTDDYIYLFKQDLHLFEDFYSKLDFVLQNIDPIEYPNVDYWERRWKHERFLKELFPTSELSRKLNLVECYKEKDNGTKIFLNCFWVNCPKGVRVYLYSMDDNKYNKYSLPEFALKVKNEGLKYRQGIMRLRKEFKKLKELDDERCSV